MRSGVVDERTPVLLGNGQDQADVGTDLKEGGREGGREGGKEGRRKRIRYMIEV